MIDIDRDGPRPLYSQIAGRIAADLKKRHTPGDRLPPEIELARRFQVNRHTLRHAMEVLVSGGWVERRRGLGTYVLDRPIEYPLHSRTRFTETVSGLGHALGGSLIAAESVPADEEIAARLQLSVGDTIYRIQTVRLVDGRPTTSILHHLPCGPLPELLARYQGGSLHALLRSGYGIGLRRATTLVSAILPTEAEARLLHAPRHLPMLLLRTVNVDLATGEPREYAVARTRSDRIELRIDHPDDRVVAEADRVVAEADRVMAEASREAGA